MSKRVLAFDLGASSGRAMIADFDGASIKIREIHRFSNDPVRVNGTLYWDILRLFHDIKTGINLAVLDGGFDSIGIDTWGVDFGLLDKSGRLLENPVHYRDSRNDGVPERVFQTIPRDQLYQKTGIQIMSINTIFQLYHLVQDRPDLMERADSLLFIPDLLNYMLTGERSTEYTIASTSQLLDAAARDWDYTLLRQIGIPQSVLTGISKPGTVVGTLLPEIQEELNAPAAEIISICEHDTASAVVSVPAEGENFIYISSGTWSLMGTELPEPVINETSFAHNLTNEGGYDNTIRFLKNIMGLWLIQESRRQWIREGATVSYGDLEREALAVQPFQCFIDPDHESFAKPGNMPKRVQEFCARTGQTVPQTRGEIMRCIYESLALKYRYTKESIEDVTGRVYSTIHVVGGGTKDTFLCQLTADACDVPVIAGPIEATVLGNVATQLMASGDIGSLSMARRIIANSFDTVTYNPNGTDGYQGAFERFCSLIGQ